MRLSLAAADGPPLLEDVPRETKLEVYVGDVVTPRATVRLQDLFRHGKRPLNIEYDRDDIIRIVLRRAPAEWPEEWGELTVKLTVFR
jgi:hypothetical protein